MRVKAESFRLAQQFNITQKREEGLSNCRKAAITSVVLRLSQQSAPGSPVNASRRKPGFLRLVRTKYAQIS
jgi:hypothetical protein